VLPSEALWVGACRAGDAWGIERLDAAPAAWCAPVPLPGGIDPGVATACGGGAEDGRCDRRGEHGAGHRDVTIGVRAAAPVDVEPPER
jgi:hypothetical protein